MALELDPNYVFRDFETDHVPSSGAWDPSKPEIRRLLTDWWQVLIGLVADAGGLELPNLLINMSVTGGNANNIVAEANLPVPDGPGLALFSIVTEQVNTGHVTINGKPVLTSSGQQILPGGLVSGVWLFLDAGDAYHLVSDQASAAFQAAVQQLLDEATEEADRAESARDIAESYRDDAADSASAALTSKNQAELAALAAGAPLFIDEPDIASAPSPYLLQVEVGTQVWEHDGTSRTMVGWLGRIDFPSVQELASFASFLGSTGTVVHAGGFRYRVAPTSATDQHLTTSGGVKLYALPDETGAVNLLQFNPDLSGQDNAALANLALQMPQVRGVILPPGDIRVDQAITMRAAQSGKFVRGAGIGVTRLIRTDNLADIPVSEYQHAGVIVRGGIGCQISDLTVVSPKTTRSFNGIWFRETAMHGLVERVECNNCSYSFWAQDNARFIVFRDIRSRNANVHFETTHAFDILFENTDADDGDGDHPKGTEACWHPLYGSKRITFRNGRHYGKGHGFSVVADAGSGDDGLVDEILFENCKSVMTQGKVGFFTSRIQSTARVGRVKGINCDLSYAPDVPAGIPMYLDDGNVTMIGGNFSGRSQQHVIVTARSSLKWYDPVMYADPGPGTYGNFYDGDGVREIWGGVHTTTGEFVGMALANGKFRSDGSSRFIGPGRIAKIWPPLTGFPTRYVFPVDLEHNAGEMFGAPDPTGGRTNFVTENGAFYRIRLRGKMKWVDGNRTVGVRIDALGGTLIDGWTDLETAPGTIQRYLVPAGGQVATYSGMDEARFSFDITMRGNGGPLRLNVPNFTKNIVVAGTEFFAERID